METSQRNYVSGSVLKTLDELLAEADTHPRSLITPDLLPYSGRMFLYGFPGVGKSLIATQLAFEVASGLPWLGCFEVDQPGRVLYLQCELPEDKFRERVRRMSQAYPGTPSDNFLSCTTRSLKVTPHDQEFAVLLEELQEARPVLWIIDPEYKVFIGDENQSYDMQQFYDQLDRVAESVGCAILMVSHRRKTQFDEAGGRRDAGFLEIPGSQRRIAWADSIVRLAQSRNGKQVVFEKTRYSEAPVSVWLEFDEETLVHRGNERGQLEQLVLQHAQNGVPHRSLMDTLIGLNYSESTIRRTLERLEQEGKVRVATSPGDKRQKEVRTTNG